MNTTKALQRIAERVARLEALNPDKEALVFFSLTDGEDAYSCMGGKALLIQGLLEDRYRNDPLFKTIIDRIAAGESVLKPTGDANGKSEA